MQHLRAESSPEGMATLQAIACAMSIIEGVEVGQKLMSLYEAKLQNTLIGRGQIGDSPFISFNSPSPKGMDVPN